MTIAWIMENLPAEKHAQLLEVSEDKILRLQNAKQKSQSKNQVVARSSHNFHEQVLSSNQKERRSYERCHH